MSPAELDEKLAYLLGLPSVDARSMSLILSFFDPETRAGLAERAVSRMAGETPSSRELRVLQWLLEVTGDDTVVPGLRRVVSDTTLDLRVRAAAADLLVDVDEDVVPLAPDDAEALKTEVLRIALQQA